MNPASEVWTRVLDLLKKQMTPTTINTWFDDAAAVSLEEDRFVMFSPTPFKRDIIASRYAAMIREALYELFSADLQVVVLTQGELEGYNGQKKRGGFLPGAEEYTFERFVVGSSNKFAHAAARAVADNPGQSYNPLFLYGESGLGKTHLLYAIAHTIHDAHPEYKIVYIKGDAFTNELVTAIREGRNQEFREKFRGADVFLMDDVQFIAGRDSTQEEMFHTFNTLYEQKKQIVFTSDRPPKELLRLEDRLKTRFEWGLLADIQPPDYETRVAIVKNKAIARGVKLPDSVLQYVAENITANVRQIEGTVSKLVAMHELEGAQINVDNVIRALRDMLSAKNEFLPSPELIISEVAQFYDLDVENIKGQGQNKNTSAARNVAMYLIRNMTDLSLQEIGAIFNNRHYSTVISSVKRVEGLIRSDPDMGEIIRDLKSAINGKFE